MEYSLPERGVTQAFFSPESSWWVKTTIIICSWDQRVMKAVLDLR